MGILCVFFFLRGRPILHIKKSFREVLRVEPGSLSSGITLQVILQANLRMKSSKHWGEGGNAEFCIGQAQH